jgi:acyl-[acyl-carrier-protein]-phospholipid O-acyltransferase/long-chain-fatty-acid--[acyl-carrier-protein] ligase
MLKVKGFLPYLVMLFLNAYVDLGHKIVIQNTVFKTYDGDLQVVLTSVVNALILLPFILFFSPAGFISDKYPKQKVMRLSAWAAIVITLAITGCYYLGWFWPAFAMTFLLAVQSAIYSPAKYGYIKELLGKEHLAQGNGIVQAVTTISILAGILGYSILFEARLDGHEITDKQVLLRTIAPLGWSLVALSCIELVMAYRLPATQSVEPDMHFAMHEYLRGDYLRKNLHIVTVKPVIWISILGLTLFWAVSQVMLAAFPAFAKQVLSENNTVVVQGLLACSGIGIMLGSMIAGAISKHHIETGTIPLGALGFAFGLFLIPLINTTLGFAAVFILIGISGGLFIIPLNALIQFHAAERENGRILAANNFIQNVGMFLFLLVTVALAYSNLSGARLIWLLAIVAILGATYIVIKLPQSLVRLLFHFLSRSGKRIAIHGFKHIPEQGGLLMVGNSNSWLDWAAIQIAMPRSVHFVMDKRIYQRWYLNWLFRLLDVIPVSKGDQGPVVNQVLDLLRQGKVVCLLTVDASQDKESRLDAWVRDINSTLWLTEPLQILPFYLNSHGHASSRCAQLVVSFGLPIAGQSTSTQLKSAVFELSQSSPEVNDKAVQK